ncbi:NAD(P)-dependent oxidoreductase [Zunongwangia sp. F363]|uniref:NAD(P)-dependent oxidoreductase n=1 Tax=Autumnicola tepida TaxID=3075595 RepID=A0ABU3CC93_9FLAO|nr:NAD(P)-dependent oxidoreductase [Zunongwangia sp. F363]MDT0643950.1 NAD(P)-dependent oxidoreductase [Zunongwangia sp. F363]
MPKFNKIVSVDHTKLQEWAVRELQNHSKAEVEIHKDYPSSKAEIIERIGDAEAVLVSWRTPIDKEIIENCPNLKYIGMCCSLYDDESANVAVKFAREQGIEVRGIRDYGDPGVIEFIVSALVRLLHGFGENQWKEMPAELTNRKIGIIGLGVTGQLLAKCLLPFGADLYYFSRSRKKEWETKNVKYLPLDELLETSEIISIHLPKNIKILKQSEFQKFGSGKILINTSLGLPFDEKSFQQWIGNPSNVAIFDGDGKSALDGRILKNSNIISAEKSAGWSAETETRLSQKVVENIQNFLGS